MGSSTAVLMCVLFVLWLFARDAKRRKFSAALWIPLTWAFIIASKPPSTWLGLSQPDIADIELEGSPFDRAIFLVVIAAGFLVLARRGANWGRIIQENQWLFIYFLYLGISVLWSEYSFIAFKRWIKDLGSVVMVLVVLGENDPVQATKGVLARSAYLLIPPSLLLTRYYWILGGYYDPWTGQPIYTGVTRNKNEFGMTLFVCGLALVWILLDLRNKKPGSTEQNEVFRHLGLLCITIYLFYKAHSATALVCTVLGVCILFGMRHPAIRSRINRLGGYMLGLGLLVLVLHASLDLGGIFVKILGRDLTFTGRTEIWRAVLNEKTNPLFGVGYYSFWMGDRVRRLSDPYYYTLNEAHNGYLETYVNTGLVGLSLLLAVLFSAGKRIKRQALTGEPFATFRLTAFVAVIFYAMTEAIFNRLSPIWFLLLLVMVEYPRRQSAVAARGEQRLPSETNTSHRASETAGVIGRT